MKENVTIWDVTSYIQSKVEYEQWWNSLMQILLYNKEFALCLKKNEIVDYF